MTSLCGAYRYMVGVLGWISKTRPEIAVAFAMLGGFCATPTRRHMAAAERIIHYIRTHPLPLTLKTIHGTPVLHAYTDASFQRKLRTGRAGWKVFLLGADDEPGGLYNTIAWATRKLKSVGSSTSAELMALEFLVKRLWTYISLIWKVWRVRCQVYIYIDSRPLFDQLRTGQCKEEPGFEGVLDYCITNSKAMRAEIEWIERDRQLADDLTKPDIYVAQLPSSCSVGGTEYSGGV
eukprot:GHVU01049222.1.p1 GENE.GHVU01049222.1~~GHVU01049222.1.p1  ORF type:complete len:235 (-),score=9.64 GHVU01049222.1:156-860(-)